MKRPLDFETRSSYDMVLVARDRGTPESLESRTNVLVDVEDVQVSQSLSIFKTRSSLLLLVSSNGKHNFFVLARNFFLFASQNSQT